MIETQQKNHNKLHLSAGILISAILVFGILIINKPICHLLGLTGKAAFLNSRILFWIGLALLFCYTRKIEKQKLLLWRDQRYTFIRYLKSISLLLLTVFGTVISFSIIFYILKLPYNSSEFEKVMNFFRGNLFLIIFTCVTAGVVEELIFRGYLLPRLELLFKNKYLAIGISSLLFGLLHFGFGTLINIIGPIIIGFVFALHYHEYRNVKVVIIVHFLWDFILLMLKTNVP
jgi:membrane protease YdiL (CAAX protease family)